jgi:hypothetical protein
VFFTKTNTAKIEAANASARARAAGLAAQAAAQNAALSAAAAARTAAAAAQATAQTAASGVSSGVQQGVYSARSWTAPRLELAADHVTKTVAPSVSSALRSTAKQVKPVDPARQRTRSALTWSLLGAAILATAGAAFALIRYQFRAATQDETVEVGETATDVPGKSATPPTSATPATPATSATPTPPVTPAAPSGASGTSSPSGGSTSATRTASSKTAANKTATTTDTSVNGHVASNGW